MPSCPKCGVDTGNAKFCPNCGAQQGAKIASQPVHLKKSKERYVPLIGACLCCCLGPVVTFLYYYFTEPDEDSFMKTFIFTTIMCVVGIGISVGLFILIMIISGGEAFNIFDF